MAPSRNDLNAAIAVTRFGLGARPGEIAHASRKPRDYLMDQIRIEGADLPQGDRETTAQRLVEFRAYRQNIERAKATAAMSDTAPDPVKGAQNLIRENTGGDSLARTRLAIATEAGFRERWALFWANHFTVSATRVQVATLVGPYEAEAIRPHVFGRFADLLTAAETHPAMLLYLDQAQSMGPNSPAAKAAKRGAMRRAQADIPPLRRGTGLNENLAREILELHTVGIDGGYSQADVTEFARALTGLSVAGPRDFDTASPVVFREFAHEPGDRTVMGARYSQSGRAQAGAILRDLAAKPQTARFVCTKIARHFVADDPPAALVSALASVWIASGGDLARVAEALVDAPDAWRPDLSKFKTPYEFVVSSYRTLGMQPRGPGQLAILTSLGQRPFAAPSPKGWPDEAGPWISSDALVKRMQFAQALAVAAGPNVQDPNVLARETLGAHLSTPSATAISRAESRAEAVAILLMTPEFQRR
jgi:uncharacterized protein (DUF1800 family)